MNRRVFTRCIATTLTALVTLGTLGVAAQAKVIHVRKAAPGPVHDGSSWERAFTTVSEALAASNNLDEVWVAEGTYPERIELRYGVGLYGGFAGTETGRDQRDPDAHVTTLDGERKGTVVVARANAANTVVDGFHIANGMREERTWYGPGYVNETGQAGGGIFCEHAPTLFANLVIRDCAGYGLDCRGESTVTLRQSTVRDCENAGIHSADSTPVITHNAISGNGTQFASGMYLYAISAFRSSVTITNNIITDNGEGVLLVDSRGALTSNTIADNPEGVTAAYNVPIQHGTPAELTVVNNILAFNKAGFVYNGPAEVAMPVIHHNVVTYNTVADFVGLSDPAVLAANISKAPAFVDRRKGDYHLSPFSPAIDAGNDSAVPAGATDMDGEARIQFGHVDIGADESSVPYQAPVPVVVRVRPDGDDAKDGATWESALRTVQAALDLAAERGGGEVWVAEGIYPSHLVLRPGVSLYGGFAGTEAARADRQPRQHETILDGGREGTVIRTRSGPGEASVIDGFTIRNSYIGEGIEGYGCGIACEPGSAPVITRNILLHNTGKRVPTGTSLSRPAGAIYSDNASPTIVGNVVMDNGGIGIYCAGGAPVIAGNTVTGNSGAAIRLDSSPARVENNIAAFNMAGIKADTASLPIFRGNCVYGNGGYAYDGVADPTGADGNIAADPRFASDAYGNWHLQPDSPCVNAGISDADPRTDADIDGQPRVQGGRIDIGADESDGTTWTVTPRIIRVRPDGDDANDGSSWALAKRTVGAAVEAARTGGEVWVASGAYVESVPLPPHVFLYGGFAGQESRRDERRWRANTATLQSDTVAVSAQFGYRSSAVDGFTIRSTSASMRGIAIRCDASSPEIANNTILMAGNGIDGTGAPHVHDCVLRPAEGAVPYYGVRITSLDAPLSITHNQIRQCEGSGIYLNLSGGLIANNVVIGGGTGISTWTSSVLTQEVTNNTVIGAKRFGIEAAAATIANNLLANNGFGFRDSWKATLTLRNNNSYGNIGPNYPTGVLDPTGADGNISLDPKLISADDWHIRPESPCVDAGADAFATWPEDLDGQARIAGGHVDIGADEVHAALGYTVPDVEKALAIAAGLANADAATRERLDVVPDGPEPSINIADAVRLIRKAMWLEPNP